MLSVVVPAYNEERSVPCAVARISDILIGADIPFELIFVDDGSTDGTWDAIVRATEASGRVRGVRFSRNFGKEPAILAGLEAAQGTCCVVLDCDLQHPPEKIVDMYQMWEEGFEVIEGVKEDRGNEGGPHRVAARIFYDVMGKATGMDMQNSSDFKLLDRKAVDALLRVREQGTFFRALSFWVGFRRGEVPYRVANRTEGESKWSTRSLFRYAVKNVASFSAAPLHIVTALGVVMFVVSIIFGTIAVVQRLSGYAADGFTTVILLQLFIGSLIMISLGLIGYYVARIYEEAKGRPRYIVSETCGDTNP